jgi:hypothetical protein
MNAVEQYGPVMPEKKAETAGVEFRAPKSSIRNEGIDFVRGLMIIVMILYHSSVFAKESYSVAFLCDYVFTVASGAFVFMAGMSVRKYSFCTFFANATKCSRALIARAIKLIFILCAAVAVGNLFCILPPPQGSIHDYIVKVFLIGYPKGVPYDVLLGIGYLFLISPLILFLLSHRTFSFVTVLLAISATTAAGYRVGHNTWIVLCGLWGMTLTHVILQSFDAQNRYVLLRLPRMLSLVAFLVAACTYAVMGAPKENIVVYVFYVTSFLMMRYHMFVKSPSCWKDASATRMICGAGRMSLWWYVVHVPVVVVLKHTINWGGGSVISFIIGFLVVVGLTAALISVIHFFWGRVTALQYI